MGIRATSLNHLIIKAVWRADEANANRVASGRFWSMYDHHFRRSSGGVWAALYHLYHTWTGFQPKKAECGPALHGPAPPPIIAPGGIITTATSGRGARPSGLQPVGQLHGRLGSPATVNSFPI